MSVRLDDLLAGLGAELHGDPATPVNDVVAHSRQIARGALFVALRGTRTDGHRFIGEAADAGAAAVLVEEVPEPLEPRLVCARVPDTLAALPLVAARFHGNPAKDLTLIGVTGTNGKTSTVRMIESIFEADGHSAGSLTTICVRYRGVEHPAELTTPEADSLQRTLARMRGAGVDTVAMEVSSHALVRGRVATLRFAAAVFTNLSQDHLDFHGDMAAYAGAKQRLFSRDYLDGTAVVNIADPAGASLADTLRQEGRRVRTYARGPHLDADVRTVEENVGLEGAQLVIEEGPERYEVRVPLPGDFQVENALAAIATARGFGVSRAGAVRGLEACPPVPGRLERVGLERPLVLVDYAHTPDALDRVLSRLRPTVSGRLITVFGCGGDRDRAKRAPMAHAACRHSDYVVATSDNPRTEDPRAILREITEGLSGAHDVIVDRREAIQHAVRMARAEDVVVIAGKGHETYQIVGERYLPFDDREEARRALKQREAAV
jgi:UDP-N-acetylmuramoyl-L-alanyl-D-glutamate--2,6-diaminopimelate ligase